MLRTVRSSLSRFLAIFAIVALGVGFLSGLLASPVDMRLSADRYCRDAQLYDIKIQATQGLTDDDLAAVTAIEGVGQVMPAWDMDLVLDRPATGESLTSRLMSLPAENAAAQMNQLTLVEGRLPSAPGEAVITASLEFGTTLPAVGETLTVDPVENDEDVTDALPDTLTVVGTVRSAAYFSLETEYTNVGTGTVDVFLYTPAETFDMDSYTTFYIAVEGARALNSFSGEYEDTVAAVYDRLDDIKAQRAQARYDEIIDEAEQALADARQEYEDAKAEAEQELADAAQELADGWAELADAEQELADAKFDIDVGQLELDDAKDEFYLLLPGYRQQIADGYARIESGRAALDEGQARLDEGRAQLEQLKAGKDDFWEMVPTLNGMLAMLDRKPIDTSDPDPSDQATINAIAYLQQVFGSLPGGDQTGGDQTGGSQTGGDQTGGDQTGGGQTGGGQTGGMALTPEMIAGLQQQLEQLALLKQRLEQLAAQGTTLDASLAALDAQQAQLDANRKQLEDGLGELQAQERQLEQTKIDTENQFAVADEKLLDARQQYADGLAELEEGRQELIDGQKEYEDAKAEADQELADGWEEILDAESKVREIEKGKWVLGDRGDNAGISSYGDNADKIAAIATVFPVFFFLVAALVALTTMTRMVEEERGQVGTMKALGYSRRQIAAKYILYALAATLAGSAVGMLVGMQLFPRIILSAYGIMYDLPVLYTPFNPLFGTVATAAALACTLIATFNACGAELKEQPASLMLPKAPKAGKRIFLEHIRPLWRRMRFTHKVTARNLFLYKKRFFMTVVGIAGCTALLVTGFGVRDSISNITALQFEELAHYQLLVSLQDESALEGRDLRAILDAGDRITDSLAVSQQDMTVVPEEGKPADNLYITVPSDADRMQEYFTFRQRGSGEPVEFGEGEVIATEKLAERQGLAVGDTITVENGDGQQATFTITGICENYVYHYLYMTADTYRAAFGEDPEPNLLYCRLAGGIDDQAAEGELASDLLKCRDVAGAQFTHEITASFTQSIDNINYIVVVLIIAAGALAFVVLYNLTNINITERAKELATIKVLGFFDGEVAAYIYRETSILTLIGTGCGLLFGIALHTFVIRTAEVDMVMFGRSIFPLSFVWSALLTILFSLLVNLVMYRKLKSISMVESLKAPE